MIAAIRTGGSDAGCRVHWIAKVRILGHGGRWTAPRPWL
jgi:hypothetical protein